MNRRDVIKRTAWITGMAISAPVVSGILSGCQAEGAPEWVPEFMSPEQAQIAAEMAEAILPKTADSPGAKDVHVAEFMDKLIKECFLEKDKENFLLGLDVADQAAQAMHGKGMVSLTPEERHLLVADMDKKAKAELEAFNQLPADQKPVMPEDPDLHFDTRPFFIQFKQLTIAGYFTSEEVGTKVLAYDPVPGEYNGCIDYPNEEYDLKTAWAL